MELLPKNLRRTFVFAALEVAATAQFVLLCVLPVKLQQYFVENQVSSSSRRALLLVPLLAAMLTRLGAPLLVRRFPGVTRPLSSAVRRLLPLVVLWPLPVLLVRGVFAEDELFLLALTALTVCCLELSLRAGGWSERGVPRWNGKPSWLTPPLVTILVVSATFAFACHGSIQVHHKMLTSNYDFGLFENLFWNTLHGRHGTALGFPYFADHAEFLLYVLLPIYWLFPHSETLLVLQAALVVGTAIPLYLLASRWLRSAWQATVLVCVYLGFPSVHGVLFYDFHFLALSGFFVLWACLFYARRSWIPFWASVGLAAACREDVALGIGTIGMGLLLIGRSRKVAAALTAVGFGWFVVVKFIWMERFGAQVFSDYYAALVPARRHGFFAVVETLLSNPVYALSRSVTLDKLVLAAHLLIPLAFLPVRRARALILFFPGLVVVGLATNNSAITQFQFHYSMHFVPYAFVASIAVLAGMPRARRSPVLVALTLGALVSAVQWSAFFGRTFRTNFQEVSFSWTPSDARRAAALEQLAQLVPATASVSAGEYEGPQFARRLDLFSIKDGTQDSDYVVYSARSLRWGGDDNLREALRTGQYGVIARQGDMTLLKRGAPDDQNARAIRMLEHPAR